MRWRAFGKPTPYTHIYTRYAAGLTGLGGAAMRRARTRKGAGTPFPEAGRC